MESVLNTPYYGYNSCGLLYATAEQNNPALAAQRALELYNLRSRNGPLEIGKPERPSYPEAHVSSKRERKTQANRSRSLYSKRLLVNARERERMKTLNKGFENLRNALPCYIADGHISKITTLRLAINYIKTLNAVLQDAESNEEPSLVEQQPCSVEVTRLTSTDGTNVCSLPVASEAEIVYSPQFAPVLTIPRDTKAD